MLVSDFDFELPDRLIAAHPAEPRDAARLMVVDRATRAWRHETVRALPSLLRPGDLLVVNDTRVLPHRLCGRRPTGGAVQAMILSREGVRATGYLKPAAKVTLGQPLVMEDGALRLVPREDLGAGVFRFDLEAGDVDLDQQLERVGRAPLPPYIRRGGGEEDVGRDRRDYQTVFAAHPGAIAAPTAGLHFTPALLDGLRRGGVELATVTLHVGVGTFSPVRVEQVEEHRMHPETFVLPAATAEAVERTRARGGRVVAVGTTSARTLESQALPGGLVAAGAGDTSLFLYPGKSFAVVDVLLTNFHLPKSTLMMLISTFADRELIRLAYREAIAEEYRFYSFGDAMLLV